MSTNAHSAPAPHEERSTQLSRATTRVIEVINSATPEERAELFKVHGEQLTALSLMLDGLVQRGVLPGRERTDSRAERPSSVQRPSP